MSFQINSFRIFNIYVVDTNNTNLLQPTASKGTAFGDRFPKGGTDGGLRKKYDRPPRP